MDSFGHCWYSLFPYSLGWLRCQLDDFFSNQGRITSMRNWKFGLFAAVCAVVVSIPGQTARAGVLVFDSDVIVEAGSSVGATTLNADTAVHFHGSFDSSVFSDFGFAATYPFTSLSITVSGLGTFSAANPSDSNVLAVNELAFGFPAIGLSNFGVTGGYYGLFGTTSEPFTYTALTPNVFSDPLFTASAEITISLAGGAGDFHFLVAEYEPTFTKLSIPEPGTLAVFGIGGVALLIGRVRRRNR
ncbi:MAG: PEP-CTERM sorting domain-containing protein [Planctomycetes bacterium]|nr:PEP-CTERM sorting domain-containing protein [Planctomycetota bacterium]